MKNSTRAVSGSRKMLTRSSFVRIFFLNFESILIRVHPITLFFSIHDYSFVNGFSFIDPWHYFMRVITSFHFLLHPVSPFWTNLDILSVVNRRGFGINTKPFQRIQRWGGTVLLTYYGAIINGGYWKTFLPSFIYHFFLLDCLKQRHDRTIW